VALAEAYIRTKWHLDLSSRLVTTDMGRKLGAVPLFERGELGPHKTQCGLVQGPPLFQVTSLFVQPFDHNRQLGNCAPLGEGAWPPSKTTWLGPRPTTMSSFILIHPTVWPQYTKVTDRQDRQTERQTDNSPTA